MIDPPPALNPLEPGQRWVMHIHAVVPALALIAAAFGLGQVSVHVLEWPWWPPFVLLLPLALWSLFVAPSRRFATWGWALAEDELHVAHGVWTRVHTIVPLTRVQHIDVAQGPVERGFGVAQLIVHTAGTAHATVGLPGLSRATADELRDTIRGHVRSDPW